jgi:alpha-tubulin suppressor-like RCC1 family protein
MDEKMFDVPMESDWRTLCGISDAEDDKTTVRIQNVICGPSDTAIITSDGRCFVSGINKYGQLGLGHKNAVPKPVELKLPTDPTATEEVRVRDVALGSTFSAFVDTTGDLYTAGFGGSTLAGFGCLGHGDGRERLNATLVESLIEDGCYVQQVAVGEYHMTVLTTEGEVLSTGSGSYGRLGNFDTIDQLYLEPVELLTPESKVTSICGGKSFTLALAEGGIIYGWGRNHKGQLGTGLGLAVDMYAMQAVPEPIETDELANRKVIKIAAGASHAAAITESGELFFWGMSLHLEPVRVDSVLHTKIVDVACGQDYTLAIDEKGKMYSFGIGKTGVLGQGSAKRLNQAMLMEAFDKKRIVQASAGYMHAACLAEDTA